MFGQSVWESAHLSSSLPGRRQAPWSSLTNCQLLADSPTAQTSSSCLLSLSLSHFFFVFLWPRERERELLLSFLLFSPPNSYRPSDRLIRSGRADGTTPLLSSVSLCRLTSVVLSYPRGHFSCCLYPKTNQRNASR